MNWIKVDEEVFDLDGKRISEGDTALHGLVTYQMMENFSPLCVLPKANAILLNEEHITL